MSKTSRKQEILQALAQMLEASPGGKITTASLAKEVGVSEAALYRHFPSKAKMIEGLIEFAEETLFSRIGTILSDHEDAATQCHNIIFLLLTFVERNPGFARLFVGDALQGETERLRARMCQLLDRIETQIRQCLREERALQKFGEVGVSAKANLLLASAEGQIMQFVRSDFRQQPTAHWKDQWTLLSSSIFANA
ncbi:MAG: nucleoid occlusion factor SlmA [Pseudomonadales bacterium]|jgi:TetR/AcrR family transcriptional regulator|nr:nucleoid occlusion factor SlmA [Pseudomonadales bacterium]